MNNEMTVYVFMMRFKGTRLENEGFMHTNNSGDEWIAAIRQQVGNAVAKIVLFDIGAWNCPPVHIERIENDLPSISFGISVENAVRNALRAHGIAETDLEKVIESESRIVLRSNYNGYVLFLFSPDISPVLEPPCRGFP